MLVCTCGTYGGPGFAASANSRNSSLLGVGYALLALVFIVTFAYFLWNVKTVLVDRGKGFP